MATEQLCDVCRRAIRPGSNVTCITDGRMMWMGEGPETGFRPVHERGFRHADCDTGIILDAMKWRAAKERERREVKYHA